MTGGLGNQMFQYAFGRRLAEKHSAELKLDLGFYSDKKLNSSYGAVREYDLEMFNIREAIATDDEIARLSKRTTNRQIDRLLDKILGVKETVLREPHYHFSQAAFNAPDNRYLIGYWQSEKYFADIENVIRADFTFREPPSKKASEILERVKNSNSVGVHVRRGDFLVHPLNGVYGVDYYRIGEQHITERVSDPHYFVFSDDIEWCRDNLRFAGPTEFVDDEFDGHKLRDDFRLISACKHFIIANSSFSWWAAWLGENADKVVVAPHSWALDQTIDKSEMYLPGWIRVK